MTDAMREEFITKLELTLPHRASRNETNLKRWMGDHYNWLMERTSMWDNKFNFRERIEVIYADIYSPVKCSCCDNEVRLDGTSGTWAKTCSKECRIKVMSMVTPVDHTVDISGLTREGFVIFLEKEYPTPDSRNERYLSRNWPVWYSWLMQYTSFLDNGEYRFIDRLSAAILGINSIQHCHNEGCSNLTKSQSGLYWNKFCGNLCSAEYGRKILKEDYHSDEQWCYDQADRVSNGIMTKYGVANPMSIEGVQDRIIYTNRERFGADYHTQTKDGADKISAGLRRMFNSSEGDHLREAKRDRLVTEFARAEADGDITYMDKGRPPGGKSRSEAKFRAMVEEIVGYPLTSKYIKCGDTFREIDIFIPSLNLGIEFNGLYSHSVEGGKSKSYHLDKQIAAESVGIHLITVWEDDFSNRDKLPVVLNRIRYLTNNSISKVYARKCILSDKVDLFEYRDFLCKNHIQGDIDHSSVRLGLRYEGKLVAVMGFKKCPSNVKKYGNPEDVWELCRFATSSSVVGGFSKLLKSFVETKLPRLVYSFGDRMIVDITDNVYLKNGFKQHSVSKPDYSYIYRSERKHKFGFRKDMFSKLGFDISNKTEEEIRIEAKLPIIWDAGKVCYTYTVN